MQAYDAYQEIRNCIAFNVPNYVKKHKVNQHVIAYTFADNSVLRIFPLSSKATVTDENGYVLVIGALRINRAS